MSLRAPKSEKITVSLAAQLVHYADQRAAQLGISRSQVIGQAVAVLQAQDQANLAQEGYLFYAAESDEFAAVSLKAVTEALEHDGG